MDTDLSLNLSSNPHLSPNKLRIGFILATNDIDVQWFKPLSFGYLKGYLNSNLTDPVTMTLLEASDNIETFDLLAISSTSQNYFKAMEIAKTAKIKNHKIITILGGHHITYLHETLTRDFDIGVLGEGEQTFLELIEYFQDCGLTLQPEKMRTINGIVFWENEHLIKTEKRELITPLEKLPHPDRSSGGAQYTFTSRGCPFKCSFCSSSAFWDKTRFFNAEYVVEEIEQLLALTPDTKQIPIWDDLFIANKPRFKKIVDLLEARGITQRVTFSFSVRANLLDDEMCQALKRLNVIGIAFGAESGSNRILKLMNKGATVEQNQQAIDILKKHGIPVMCSFIVGWPTETEDEIRETFEFIYRNIAEEKLSTSNAVNILMPLPGTALWNSAISSGLVDLKDLDWKRLSVFASYKDSNIKSFDDWVAHRRKSNSLYLNENTLPQERLYERMAEYYKTIELLETCDSTKRADLVFTSPETVNLELTLRCNLKCKMCQRSFEGFSIPTVTDMQELIVDRMLPLLKNSKTIWLSGFGEPLMREDIVPIIQKIRAANQTAEIAFTTNFVLMTGRKLVDIIESGLSLIQVSMDGDNEMGHAFAPTREGVERYQKLLWNNLRTFYETKQRMGVRSPRLQFCFVGMKRNIAQLAGIIQQGMEVGLSSIVVQPVRDYDGSMKGEDLFENRAYALPLLERAREYAHQNGVEFICRFMDEKMSVTRQQCTFPREFFHVSVNGDVYMCCEGIAANQNIGNTDPVAIWNSPPYLELRRELASGKLRKKCWDCSLVKPTTDSKSAIRQGLLELSQDELANEIITYRNYIDGCHEREQALMQQCAAIAVFTKPLKPFLAYTDIMKNIHLTEAALTALTRSVLIPQDEGTMIQECTTFFNSFLVLLNRIQTSQETFPDLHGVAEEMICSAKNTEQIVQSLASCTDLATVNLIISGQMIQALAGLPDLFMKCRNEINQSIESIVNSM